jgi:hypothetical protein
MIYLWPRIQNSFKQAFFYREPANRELHRILGDSSRSPSGRHPATWPGGASEFWPTQGNGDIAVSCVIMSRWNGNQRKFACLCVLCVSAVNNRS